LYGYDTENLLFEKKIGKGFCDIWVSTGRNESLAADAVREYKKLMDEGIISQEEFDKKKKELLGL